MYNNTTMRKQGKIKLNAGVEEIIVTQMESYSIPTESVTKEEFLLKNKPNKMQKIKKLFTKKNLLTLLFIVLSTGLIYFFVQYKKLSKSPAEVAKEKTTAVIKQISALAVVPSDPNAVLANVTDVTKLKDQAFFADAQNGDEIVIFPSAMRAVLYRPSINKIINIGPLSSSPAASGDVQSSKTDSKTTTPEKTTTKAPAKK